MSSGAGGGEGIFPVRPFVLPLTREALCAALHDGRGRAWMHVRECGGAGAADTLVELLTHGHRYDNQCESDRSEWLIEIASILDESAEVFERVLAGVRAPLDPNREEWQRDHDLGQRVRTAFHLARLGVPGARQALYGLLRRCSEFEWIGDDEILELDGVAGLVHLAKVMAVSPVPGYVGIAELGVLRQFDSVHGHGVGRTVLEAEAADPRVAAFLIAVDARLREHPEEASRGWGGPYRRTPPGTIITWIWQEQHQYAGPYAGWGFRATREELSQVYAALLQDPEPNVARLRGYAGVFMRATFPEVGAFLLRLAEHPDEEVRRRARHGLAKHQNRQIREFGLHCVRDRQIADGALHAFTRNYQAGDAAIIERALWVPQDRYELHSMCFDLLDVLEVARPADAGGLLAFVYEYNPCANCRERAVKLAMDLDLAPDWVRTEAAYDGDTDVRKAACEGGTPADGADDE